MHIQAKPLITAAGLIMALAITTAGAGPRFTFEKTEGGYIRLDTQTGAADICPLKNGKIDCIISDDARQQYEAEISKLKQRVDELEKNETKGKSSSLPSKKEIDETLGVMKYFMDGFRGMMKDEDKPDQPIPPQPDL